MADDAGGNQMPLSEGETTILLKLADNQQAQTLLQSEQAVLMQRLIGLLERIDDRLNKLDEDREAGWDDIKSHVTTQVRNWRSQVYLALFFITVVLAVVEVIDISVERWLKVLHP